MKNIVKTLRNQRELSQESLAKALGIARPTLSNIERGASNPNSNLMLKVASYFGKPVEQIFFSDDVMQVEHEEA